MRESYGGLSFSDLKEFGRFVRDHDIRFKNIDQDIKFWEALPSSVGDLNTLSIWERPIVLPENLSDHYRTVNKSMNKASNFEYSQAVSRYSNLFSADNTQTENTIALSQDINKLLLEISRAIRALGFEYADRYLSLEPFNASTFRDFDRLIIKLESAHKALSNFMNNKVALDNEGIQFTDYFVPAGVENANSLLYKYINYAYRFRHDYLSVTNNDIKEIRPVIDKYLRSLDPQVQKKWGVTHSSIPAGLYEFFRPAVVNKNGKYVLNNKIASALYNARLDSRYNAKDHIQSYASRIKLSSYLGKTSYITSTKTSLSQENHQGRVSSLSSFNKNGALEKILHTSEARVYRLNGSDFYNDYVNGKIKLENIKNLNIPKSLYETVTMATTPEDQRAARRQLANYLKSYHISYVATPVKGTKNQFVLNIVPDNLVLSASQIGKAVAGVHYNRNNKNATAYGTAMHKMAELWSQNLIKKGSISELEKLFHSGKINIEDLSEIGLVVYNNNIISGTQGYFPNGVFEGMDKIRNVNLYYENKYPK